MKSWLKQMKGFIKRYVKAYFVGSLDEEIEESFVNYSLKIEKNSEIKRIKRDIKKCYVFGEFVPDEYFMFRFFELDRKEKKEYLSGSKRKKRVFQLSTKETRALFMDKYKTYEQYKDYYHRDILKITSVLKDKEELDQFIGKHPRFIVKPIGGYQGAGIQIVNVEETVEKTYKKIEEVEPCILEEMIQQSTELGKYHPNSVNSVRIVSYLSESFVEIIFAIFRMGVGENVVDNIGAGGVVAVIDTETGMLCSDGYQYNGLVFEKHPDTNEKIKGSVIPYWEDLIKLTKELAYIVPEQRVIGWDFALTKNGWEIIEANHSPSFKSIQMIQGGIRRKVENIWGK